MPKKPAQEAGEPSRESSGTVDDERSKVRRTVRSEFVRVVSSAFDDHVNSPYEDGNPDLLNATSGAFTLQLHQIEPGALYSVSEAFEIGGGEDWEEAEDAETGEKYIVIKRGRHRHEASLEDVRELEVRLTRLHFAHL
jgi:hypothetical protein